MLKYKISPIKDPLTKEKNYSARLDQVIPMKVEEICDNISTQTTMTAHDVKAVISALEEQVYRLLRNGRSIRFGDLGSFHPTLGCKGAEKAESFTPSLIKSVRVRFVKSSRMQRELKIDNPLIELSCVNASPSAPSVPSAPGEDSGEVLP